MKKFLMILVGISAFIVGLYWITSDGATIRYRMTLTATVDGQPATGSGVIEVKYFQEPEWASLGGSREIVQVDGEAVVLDLKDRGKLFALLRLPVSTRNNSLKGRLGGGSGDFFGGAFNAQLIPYVWRNHGLIPAEDYDGNYRTYHWFSCVKGKVTLKTKELPLLFRFGDTADQATAELVFPDNLAASFGPGVNLTEVTVEITNDPITRGIVNTLPWLSHKPTGMGLYDTGLCADAWPKIPAGCLMRQALIETPGE